MPDSIKVHAKLLERAALSQIRLHPDLAKKLKKYWDLLNHWNKRINLTSLVNEDKAIDRLIIEPLIAASHIGKDAKYFIDIGSGAGSPAIPINLVYPNMKMCMVESRSRKAAFLSEAIRELSLSNARVENCRYEELLPRQVTKNSAWLLTIRALKLSPAVLKHLGNFIRPGGQIFVFTSDKFSGISKMLEQPFSQQATFPLVESLKSHLVVIRKDSIEIKRETENQL
jgi:16S rRNA (guanine527-N7)-methyltransferase